MLVWGEWGAVGRQRPLATIGTIVRIRVLLEIFYQSSISLRFLLASSCTRAEAFQNYNLWYEF